MRCLLSILIFFSISYANESLQRKVEKQLLDIVSKTVTFGLYDGQTTSLHPLGSEIYRPLLNIFCDHEYRFVTSSLQIDGRSAIKVKMLAGHALREAIGLFNEQQRKEIIVELLFFGQNPFLDPNFQRITCVTLYYLNAPIVLQKHLEVLGARMQLRPHDASAFLEAAALYTQVKQYNTALTYLQQAQKISPEDPQVYYYIAITNAMQNKTQEAIQALKTCIEKGYKDVAWIERDRDLHKLHDLPEFKKLMEETKKNRYK